MCTPKQKNMLRISVVAILILFSHSVFGQLSWGAKAGVNFNKIVYADLPENFEDESSVSVGYHFGVWGDVTISNKFSLIFELLFSQRGEKMPDYRINLNYLEVPIIVSYSPVKKLAIEAGPDVAFKLSAMAKGDDTKNKLDLYNAVDFGLTAGARFNITERIDIVGRYYYGLIAIEEINFRDMNNNPVGDGREYNRNAQVSFSYRFGSSK